MDIYCYHNVNSSIIELNKKGLSSNYKEREEFFIKKWGKEIKGII
jgi:hypothetical protein